MERLEDRIKIFLENEIIKSSKNISITEELIENGMIDSFGVVELVSFIEKEFKITLSQNDLTVENFKNVERITELIKRKI